MSTKRSDYLRADQVQVDPKVQREIDHRAVKSIVENFDESALGVISVSERTSGSFFAIDGQHRVAALLAMDMADYLIEAEIHTGLTVADEARMFRLRNKRTTVTVMDLYHTRLAEGDLVALGLKGILDAFGWNASGNRSGKTHGTFRSIAALERLYRADADTAVRTVSILTKAWGHRPENMVAPILSGLGNVLLRFGDAVDTDSMVDKLSKYEGGANNLWGNARGFRQTVRVSATDAVSEVIVRAYNVGKRSNALPNWR